MARQPLLNEGEQADQENPQNAAPVIQDPAQLDFQNTNDWLQHFALVFDESEEDMLKAKQRLAPEAADCEALRQVYTLYFKLFVIQADEGLAVLWRKQILREFKATGLRGYHFFAGGEHINSKDYAVAFSNLYRLWAQGENALGQPLTAEESLQYTMDEVVGLTPIEALGAARGFNPAEVRGFSRQQIYALEKLKYALPSLEDGGAMRQGLRPDDLRGCESWFQHYYHTHALNELLVHQRKPIPTAINIIRHLNPCQAAGIGWGLTREHVLDDGCLGNYILNEDKLTILRHNAVPEESIPVVARQQLVRA